MSGEDVTTAKPDKGGSEHLDISVKNIGGINRCDVRIAPGVTILKGQNATNRTSLLRAIADVLGGPTAALKTDADHGRIELSIDGETYSRVYQQLDSGYSTEGSAYTEQGEVVTMFVRLLEDNPVRRTVQEGKDLRELLLEPVDTDEIERTLDRLQTERDQLTTKIEQIDQERKRLPKLEEQRTTLQEQRDLIANELATVEEAIDEYEGSEAETEQAEQFLDDLEEQRNELQSIKSEIEQQEARIDELQRRQVDLEGQLEKITVPETEIEIVETKLKQKREEKRSLDTQIAELQQILRFNENILAGDDTDLPVTVEHELTAELDPSTMSLNCWTCGNEVTRSAIENQLSELREVVQHYREDRMEIEGNILELEERSKALQRTVAEESQLERQLEKAVEEDAVRKQKLEEAIDRREEIKIRIDKIEDQVEETEDLRGSELVDAYKKLSSLEFKRGSIEQQLTSTNEEIRQLEKKENSVPQLRQERDEIGSRIQELRTRIENLETRAVEEFNEHMDTLLKVLNFENIARIWIETKEIEDQRNQTRRLELNIVREASGGSVYEDTINTLSESEREVIGLVAALTGYLMYEVYEIVPVMLLDSLEAIDAVRLEAVIEHFSEFARFLIVAALPEDAAALPDTYHRITATELNDPDL